MPLLAEYAITPDVFDVASYSTPDECEARLDYIRETIMTAGLVRDLRDGLWGTLFNRYEHRLDRYSTAGTPTPWPDSGTRTWHRRGTEIVKKLTGQKRLVRYTRPHCPIRRLTMENGARRRLLRTPGSRSPAG